MEGKKMGKKALVIVDMLHDFVDEDGALPIRGLKEVTPYIAQLKAAAEENGILVVYANDAHAQDDPEFKVYGRHAVKGERGARVIDELAPNKDSLVIEKQALSLFSNPNADKYLKERNIDDLLMTGGATEYCVLGGGMDGIKNKYKVSLVVDAIAGIDINRGDQYKACVEMGRAGIEPKYTKQALEEIIRK